MLALDTFSCHLLLSPEINQTELWTEVESGHKSDSAHQSQNQFSPILGSHWHHQHRQSMGLNKTRRAGAGLDISSTCSYCLCPSSLSFIIAIICFYVQCDWKITLYPFCHLLMLHHSMYSRHHSQLHKSGNQSVQKQVQSVAWTNFHEQLYFSCVFCEGK